MRALNRDEQEERKRKVLQSVVHEFVRTGHPVGSHSVVHAGHLDLSSASVRNILADLEKEDMITHPHTSAGRIPTDKGYRSYVNSLIELQRLAVQEENRIKSEYEMRLQEIESLMSQTSKMLSSLSNYTGFVMAPKLAKNVFSHMELVPLAEKRILVGMITESGLAKHTIIHTGTEIPRETLREISRVINQNLHGHTLQEVQLNLSHHLDYAQAKHREILNLAKDLAEEIKKLSASSIYMDGTSNILNLPDMSDSDELHDLFKIIEEKQIFTNILESELLHPDNDLVDTPELAGSKNGKRRKKSKFEDRSSKSELANKVRIRIGSENPLKAMQNLSVVTSTYQLADHTLGVLGILGPKRMEYPKMIALVNYISHTMNRVLKEFVNK